MIDFESVVAIANDFTELKQSDNDKKFLNRVFSDNINKYCDRLKAINFCDFENVLDAGCGFGQWSLALSTLNQNVIACDAAPVRVNFLSKIIDELELKNLESHCCEIQKMPFKDNSFDAVFCYGAIFLTPWKKTLQEFNRILMPGGKLYVNANDIGWYLYLWESEHNKTTDYDPKKVAASALYNAINYLRNGKYNSGDNQLIELKELCAELNYNNFTQVKSSEEGQLYLNKNVPKPSPFFTGNYKGFRGVYEIVCSLKSAK